MIIFHIFIAFFNWNKPAILPSEIKIHYHLGYDWRGEFEGRKIKGGKVLNQYMVYKLSKSGKNYKSKNVEIENILNEWTENGFGENLINNCCKKSNVNKSFSSAKFQNLINSIAYEDELIIKELILDEDFIDKVYLSEKLTLGDFGISKNELVKLYHEKTKNKSFNSQEVEDLFLELVMLENRVFTVSSIVEWLKIEFEFNGAKFILSPQDLGENHVGWQITKNDFPYYHTLVSPKLNDFVASILSNKISAKKQLKEFRNNKYIEAYFN